MAKKNQLSVFLSFLLRHSPETVGLDMDTRGWVSVEQLLDGVNRDGRYRLDMEMLEQIVAADQKGRYRFNENHTRIKACQGHSIPWVQPELEECTPPERLYHGTTTEAVDLIFQSGCISRMSRHAVHMQADEEKAWQSARRWHKTPVVLVIDAARMHRDGFVLAKSENDVWCTGQVPVSYIVDIRYE